MTDSEESVIDLENPQFKITPMQHALASFCGSIVTSLIVTPLDVVKIRLQAQQKPQNTKVHKCFLYCNGLMDHICSCSTEDFNKHWFHRPPQFTGTWDALMKITRYEGITSLWSGLSPTLILAIPSTVIYFVSYEQLRVKYIEMYNKDKDKQEQKTVPFWLPGLAGSSARLVTTTIINPLELVRTKMQSKKVTYLELRQAIKILIEQDGIMGFWRGLFPHLLRDAPFSFIYWMTYETLKRTLSRDPKKPASVIVCFASGAIAGGLAASATTPFDVIKTHQQIDFGEKLLEDAPRKSKTSFQVCREIIRQFGWRGMFAGLVPRIIKVAPACAIMISSFEYSKVFFYRLAQQRDSNKYSINVNKKAEL